MSKGGILPNGPRYGRVVLQDVHLLDRPSDGIPYSVIMKQGLTMWLLLIIRFHNTIPSSGYYLLWLVQRHWRLRRHARGRLPAGSRPPLHPRWQLSNHVRVCTRLCVHCAWLLLYPGVDFTGVVHWWMLVHDVNDCLQVLFSWVADGLARLNCWNNVMNILGYVMVGHHCQKKKNNIFMILIFL